MLSPAEAQGLLGAPSTSITICPFTILVTLNYWAGVSYKANWRKPCLNHSQAPSLNSQNVLLTGVKVIFKSICTFGRKARPSCPGTLCLSAYLSTRNTLYYDWPESLELYDTHLKLQNMEGIFFLPQPPQKWNYSILYNIWHMTAEIVFVLKSISILLQMLK